MRAGFIRCPSSHRLDLRRYVLVLLFSGRPVKFAAPKLVLRAVVSRSSEGLASVYQAHLGSSVICPLLELRIPATANCQAVLASRRNGGQMKKSWVVLLGAAVTLGAAVASMAQTGNGAPKGTHYELGIIGVTDPKTQPLTGSDRHTIFVGLGSVKKGVTTNIYLTQGPFAVCDGNGFLPAGDCNGNPVPGAGNGAVFQLPCDTLTDTCLTGTSQGYRIWARELGKPGGGATVTTCGTVALGVAACGTPPAAVSVRGR